MCRLLPGADSDWLQHTGCEEQYKIEENHEVPKREKPRWDVRKLYAKWQKVWDTLEEKLGESGNVEVQ